MRDARKSRLGAIDSQAPDPPRAVGPRGYVVAGKKREGPQASGFPLGGSGFGGIPLTLQIHAASIHDRDGAPACWKGDASVLRPHCRRCLSGDGGYSGPKLAAILRVRRDRSRWHGHHRVPRFPGSIRGFASFSPWSRVMERTLAWLTNRMPTIGQTSEPSRAPRRGCSGLRWLLVRRLGRRVSCLCNNGLNVERRGLKF